MIKENEVIMQKLIDDLMGRQVALFCGAGISADSGVPLSRTFLRHVLESLGGTHAETETILDSAVPFELKLEDVLGMTGSVGLLKAFAHGTPGTPHLLIAELLKRNLVRSVMTTNFDCLIEDAATIVDTAGSMGFERLSREDELIQLTTDSPLTAPTLLKVHGSIDQLESLRCTIGMIASREGLNARYPPLAYGFHDGPHRVVLVLGYSCRDLFDVNPILESLSSGGKQVLLVQHSELEQEPRPLSSLSPSHPFSGFPGMLLTMPTGDVLDYIMTRAGVTLSGSSGRIMATRSWESEIDQWKTEVESTAQGIRHYVLAELLDACGDATASFGRLEQCVAPYLDITGHPILEVMRNGSDWPSAAALGKMAVSPSVPLDRAYDYARASRKFYDKQDNPRELAIALAAEGAVLKAMGDPIAAEKKYAKSVIMGQRVRDAPRPLGALVHLGNLHIQAGEMGLAQGFYLMAFDLASSQGAVVTMVQCLDNLSNVASLREDFDEVRRFRNTAVELAVNLALPELLATALLNRAAFFFWVDEVDRMNGDLERLRQILVEFPNPPLEARLTKLRAGIEEDKKTETIRRAFLQGLLTDEQAVSLHRGSLDTYGAKELFQPVIETYRVESASKTTSRYLGTQP